MGAVLDFFLWVGSLLLALVIALLLIVTVSVVV